MKRQNADFDDLKFIFKRKIQDIYNFFFLYINRCGSFCDYIFEEFYPPSQN